MSSILLYHHLGLGDHIILNGMVREYCKSYDRVAVFAKPHNHTAVSFMFRDLKNLRVIRGDDQYARRFIFLNKFKFGKYKYDEVVTVGLEQLDSSSSLTFEEQFYHQVGMDFSKKWTSFYTPRDHEREQALYKKIAPGERYAFVHEDQSRTYTVRPKSIGADCAIVKPVLGLTDNIFDYCTIIEKAAEIHVIDSSFMFLIDCLDYTNPNQKLFIHRYARKYRGAQDNWLLPVLKKNWAILEK